MAAQFDLSTEAGCFKALVKIAADTSKDPLKFVQLAFPWGQGTLKEWRGPDKWQTAVLSDMRDHLQSGAAMQEVFREAVAAGHGVGKSALVAWVILWALSTFPDTRGVVTANTEVQLRTKTFAELAKWHDLCIFKSWFSCQATFIVSKQPGHDKTWRIDAIPWSVTKPESFAGLHNAGKRELLIFDEASGIDDIIWETSEGALTDKDTQIFWLAFGNPTQNTGRFYECFHRFRDLWIHRHVDGRDAAGTNKQLIEQWREYYGEESDFFKIRVRGVFPDSSDLQFISRKIVDAAGSRAMPHIDYTRMAAIIGVDVARFGDDASVLRVRFGLDGRSWPKRKYRGLDGWQLGAKIAELYNELKQAGVRKVYINVDNGGVGASPIDWLKHNGYPANAVNFGGEASDPKRYKNKRAEMWGTMRAWLKDSGSVDPDDEDLLTDLTGVEYGYTPSNQLLLEKKEDMKKRGLHSPDDADALALTFAVPVNEYLDDLPSPARTPRNQQRRIRDPYL